MPAYFVTGTGTDIGKTFITTALCHQLKTHGKNVFAIKPVISGWNKDFKNPNDTLQILDSLSIPPTDEAIENVSPWRFKAPLAPNMAAEKEGKTIDFDAIVKFCKQSLDDYAKGEDDYLFIEGAGGVMSPLSNEHTYLDLMKEVDIPCIVVSGSYLGSISHTLTAVETLKQHNIAIKHVIISESENNGPSLSDMSKTLSRFLDRPIVYLPRLMKPQVRFWTALLDITNILEE